MTYLFFRALSGAFLKVDVGLLQDNIGVPPAHTLDCSHGKHDFSVTVNIRAHDTKNVLELLGDYERL